MRYLWRAWRERMSSSKEDRKNSSKKLIFGGIGGVIILGVLFFAFQKDGYKAILISAGTFEMGCTSEQEDDCLDREKPVHKVKITKDFYLMESEVTQGLYERVMGENPSRFKGLDRPVESVSWYDAVKFANILSEKEDLEQCYLISDENVKWSNKDCNGWRLPTEAEWEKGARGDSQYKYAGSNDLSEVAWYGYYDENDRNRTVISKGTKDVCGLQKNDYGLCDMSGNVWEWVWDSYDKSLYDMHADQGTVQDLYGASSSVRVIRGGSWRSFSWGTRVSIRRKDSPNGKFNFIGFRLGRTL